ncbi:hypothetical protein HPB51_026265 [Rhipicephalus microplus]|uniref:Secreted protein n=1 Tax=Rhipicephalus microplus TaxID=6941 RepID=A0A9J6D7W6_RHIMP|nr:hypothetical protein HPB51_026265 [Rhipicephalus microplus]
MPLAPRHGTAPWEALLGRLVLCAALCVCRGELPAAEPPVSFPPFRSSARCNASCSAATAAASCASPPARLPFCTHLPMRRLLLDAGSCHADRLERALRADQLACLVACEFRALLNRFDCLGGYSAKWNCHTCAEQVAWQRTRRSIEAHPRFHADAASFRLSTSPVSAKAPGSRDDGDRGLTSTRFFPCSPARAPPLPSPASSQSESASPRVSVQCSLFPVLV